MRSEVGGFHFAHCALKECPNEGITALVASLFLSLFL